MSLAVYKIDVALGSHAKINNLKLQKSCEVLSWRPSREQTSHKVQTFKSQQTKPQIEMVGKAVRAKGMLQV